MSNASKVFDSGKDAQFEQRLLRENQRLKAMIGELTIELKKPRNSYETRILQGCDT